MPRPDRPEGADTPDEAPDSLGRRVGRRLNPLTFPSRFLGRWVSEGREYVLGPTEEMLDVGRVPLAAFREFLENRRRAPHEKLPRRQTWVVIGLFLLLGLWGLWVAIQAEGLVERVSGAVLIAQSLIVAGAGIWRLSRR